MARDIHIEQALYGGQGPGGYQFLGRSAGFLEDWLMPAQQLCTGFGERPAGVCCPGCVFAQPLSRSHVAVVQVADQGQDDAGRPGALGFRIMVMSRLDYADSSGDPFALAERFPPPWQARGELPVLYLPLEPQPQRTVAQVQEILKKPEGPALLGGAQALIDGGRLVFKRAQPDTPLLHGLWGLLPESTRRGLWPASFAFGNALAFDAVVVARASGESFVGYLSEEQSENYPEGRYELSLQTSAEAGDQDELDRLFARRTRAETWRIGLVLLVVFAAALFGVRAFTPRPAPPPPAPPRAVLKLPPLDRFPALNAQEEADLAKSLSVLAEELDVSVAPSAKPETLLAAIDKKLGSPDPGRDPETALSDGPIVRRLRALLWKHDVAAPGTLTPGEMVERLRQKLVEKKRLRKEHDG